VLLSAAAPALLCSTLPCSRSRSCARARVLDAPMAHQLARALYHCLCNAVVLTCVRVALSLARYPLLLQPPIPASAPQQTAPMLQASKSSSSGNLNAKKTKKSWSERLKEKFFGMHRGTSLRSSCERRRAPHHDTARRSRACVCVRVRCCSLTPPSLVVPSHSRRLLRGGSHHRGGRYDRQHAVQRRAPDPRRLCLGHWL